MSKFAYKFSNLCGAVYKQGNVIFTGDGNCVLSPVGNRISQFDLKNNKSCTFPFENRKNICRFAVSPNGLLMITVDEDGRALLVNLHKKVVLHHFNFKRPVYDIKYSPDGSAGETAGATAIGGAAGATGGEGTREKARQQHEL